MPKRLSHTKKKAPLPPLSPGFSHSRAAYKQVHTHLKKFLGKHPHFDYDMKRFHPDHNLTLLDENKQLIGFCTVNPSLREAADSRESHEESWRSLRASEAKA